MQMWQVKASQTCMAAVKAHQAHALEPFSCTFQAGGGELPNMPEMPGVLSACEALGLEAGSG